MTMSHAANRQKARRLLKRFGTKALKISIVQKGVYRVVLENGKTYCLKRMPCPVRQLRWIDTTLRRVKRNGFPAIAWGGYPKEAGTKFYVKLKPGTRPYILCPWIHGRWPNARVSQDMRACGKALAKFHSVARRVRPSRSAAVSKIGSWPAKMNDDQQLIENYVRIAERGGFHRRMDGLLQQYGEEIIGYCRTARRMLRHSEYRRMCRLAREQRTLCHGDGGPTNFIINENGTHLIDFETLRLDLRAYDLYRCIYNSCKDHHWDFSIARHFLNGYQSVSRLNRADIELMKAWLRFPRTVHLLIRQFRSSDKHAKTEAEKHLKQALHTERKMASFLRKLDAYI